MSHEILLVYDGECPLCHRYCQWLRIRHSVGELKLINAREIEKSQTVLAEINAAGLDIDRGMVLKMGDQLYHGADAMHILALIGSRSGFLNRLNYRLFASARTSTIVYPLLRCFRNGLLKLLGRTTINNLKLPDNDRF